MKKQTTKIVDAIVKIAQDNLKNLPQHEKGEAYCKLHCCFEDLWAEYLRKIGEM